MEYSPGVWIVPQVEDVGDGLLHHHAVVFLVLAIAEYCEVARKPAGADAPLEPALRHVVELRDAVGQHEGVVVRHAGNAGAEADVLCASKRLRDEEVGRGDVLPRGGEVFADPCLPVAEAIQVNDLVEVVLEGFGDIGPRRVQGHHEAAQFHWIESSLGKSADRPAAAIS